MSEKYPLVSCIIPSYKRNDMITRAIDSVLAQTYQNIEILIVDDNEPGDSYSIGLKKVIEQYHNPRVKLLTQPKHINGAVARNFGIKNAKGEYVAFLDDDDEYLPTKIEKQVRYILNHPEYEGVATLNAMYHKGTLVWTQRPYELDHLQFKVFLRKVGVGTGTFLASKKSLIRMGGFDEALMRHQDLQFFVAYLDKFKIGLVPEVLLKRHDDSHINRPNLRKIINVKEEYFKSVQVYLQKYSLKDQKRIRYNHNFEIAFVALKEHNYKECLKYLFRHGLSMDAMKDLINRWLARRK